MVWRLNSVEIKKLPNDSYVYSLTNIKSGKLYVGSAVNVRKRIWEHLYHLKKGNHKSPHLQNTFRRNGQENFIVHLLEKVIDSDHLLRKEQNWINITRCCNRDFGYNTNLVANSRLGIKHSEKSKNQISASRKKNIVLQYSLDGNFIKEFDSSYAAEKAVNGGNAEIRKAAGGKLLSSAGFMWRYKKEGFYMNIKPYMEHERIKRVMKNKNFAIRLKKQWR